MNEYPAFIIDKIGDTSDRRSTRLSPAKDDKGRWKLHGVFKTTDSHTYFASGVGLVHEGDEHDYACTATKGSREERRLLGLLGYRLTKDARPKLEKIPADDAEAPKKPTKAAPAKAAPRAKKAAAREEERAEEASGGPREVDAYTARYFHPEDGIEQTFTWRKPKGWTPTEAQTAAFTALLREMADTPGKLAVSNVDRLLTEARDRGFAFLAPFVGWLVPQTRTKVADRILAWSTAKVAA